jgi:hypothetical protein
MYTFESTTRFSLLEGGREVNFPPPVSHTSLGGSGPGCPLLRASNEHILIVRVLRARRAPGRFLFPSFLVYFSPSQDGSDESPTARIERYTCSFQARSFSLQGWGLIDLPLRASNEGFLKPRVARAQKIISLHPLPLFERPADSMLYSASPG